MSGDDIVLGDYVLAPSGIGPLAHVWANEPFRLIYDLCHEIERLRAEVERLRAEVESQTFWGELLAGNNCWCVADDVGVCAPCAYRQTMRQNKEARRA